MFTRIRRLPSLSVAISVVAVVLAMGGGAFALASSNAKTEKKIATKVVTKFAPTLSVKHATSADTAASATTANTAARATTAGTADTVKDGAITNAKLADASVTGAKVSDHSISTHDLEGADVTGQSTSPRRRQIAAL